MHPYIVDLSPGIGSNVTPVYKSGSEDDPSNFPPISVVPILANILENLVVCQLSAYFEQF